MTDSEQTTAWRFGAFEIDPARRELRRDGVEVEVQPRVFDLLVYLARHRDRAVDKDELQDAVWPGMVITETALTRAVMKARKAVGDDASRQAVIKTVHGHGYRFVAELRPVEAPPATSALAPEPAEELARSPAAAEETAADSPSRRVGRTPVIAGLVVIALLALLSTWAWLQRSPSVEGGVRVAVLPVVDRSGDESLAWTRLGLMSYVSGLLAQDGRMETVADGSVVSLAEALAWDGDLQGESGAELTRKLRSVFGASHVLAMELRPESGALRLNFSWQGPEGRLQRGTMVGDEGTTLARGVVQSVYGSLLGVRSSGRAVEPVSADPFNNEAFARGMDLSLQGRCTEALPFFRVIMEHEPGLFAPRYEAAHCLRILGESAEAEALLDELVAEQAAIGPGRPLARALMLRGVLYNRTGRLDLAEAEHQQALQIAREVGDGELEGRILQNLSIVNEDRGDWQQAEDYLDLAVLAYQHAGREQMPGHLWSGKANLRMDQGQFAEARVFLERAIEAFREAGDRRNEGMMLNNMGYLLREMGDPRQAEAYHQRSLAIREEIGDRVGVGRVHGMLSLAYAAQGRHGLARDEAELALAVARETRDRLYEGTSLAMLASAEKELGERAAARSHYEASREIFREIDDAMRILQAELLLARMDLEEGALDAAESVAVRTLAQSRESNFIQPEIEALELLGDLARARGDTVTAIGEYREALQRVRDASWTSKEIDLSVRLVESYLETKDLEAAGPLAGALAAHPPSVPVLVARARYARASGDMPGAARLMEEARAEAGENWPLELEVLRESYRSDKH